VRITYFGHACFLVEAIDGTRIILDPYRHGAFGGAVGYRPVDESADAVIVSHLHDDHAASDTVSGRPQVFVQPTAAQVGAVCITGVSVAHDEAGGSKRGDNTIAILDDGDLRLAHLGDLGHPLDAATLQKIGAVDIVLIPVGGFFTIDHEAAADVIDALEPRIVIPMHYKTESIGFTIAPVEPFLKTQKTVQRTDGSVVEVTKATLPADRTTMVLAHCR